MEWNKEEAVRAMELAEKQMDIKDYAGARTMVFKAQKLYPGIRNASQMLTVCEVHCCAERKIVGTEPDWYGILQIGKTADETSIKKQFRKLALQLHPDKNNFPGAEAAFKLIDDAQRLLCNQSERSKFDQKLKTMRSGQQRQSQNLPSRNNYPNKQTGIHFNPVGTGTAAQFTSINPHQQKQQQIPPSYANAQPTFWTACPNCAERFQYYRDIVNTSLCCQSCMKPFIAYDYGMPSVGVNNQPLPPKKEAPSKNGPKFAPVNIHGNRGNVAPVSQPPTMTGRASVDATAPKPTAKKDVNSRMEASMKGKSVPAEPKPSGTKNRKRGRNSDSEDEADSIETESSCDMEEESDHISGQNPGLSSGRDTRRSSRKKHNVSYKENFSDDDDIGGNSEEVTEDDGNSEGAEPMAVLEVADPDFYEFDRDKCEECFASDQIWAMFDDLDGMPRFYARIKKVYSPFKVDITWLDFVAGDMAETAWKRSGLPVAVGKFKHQKTDTIEYMSTFSHKIVCDKDVRNTYRIYPQKGETWALYKNWNSKWSSDPDNHGLYEYEFVVVLSDYTKESGILVTQLVKLKGFVCLFKPTKTNGMSSFQIASNEMLKFSHRVPSFRTNGKERKDVPEGYFELDPASFPSNLEEVFDHIDGNAETVSGQINGSMKSISEEKRHMPKNGVTAKAESKILTTPDGVTAMEHRVPEQIPSSPTSPIDPGFKN